MRFVPKQKLTNQKNFIQPLFVFYLAVAIFYVTRLMGITTFVPQYYGRNDHRQSHLAAQSVALQTHQTQRQHYWLQLRLSTFLRWYSIASLLLIAATMPYALYTLSREMHFLSLSRLLGLVGNMRYVLIQGFAFISLFSICRMQRRQMSFLNRWLRLHYALLVISPQLNISSAAAARLHRLDLHSCVLLCIKILALSFVPILTVFVMYNESALERPNLFVSLLFNCYCNILQQVILIIYNACALRVGHYGKQINVLLECALVEVREYLDSLQPLNELRRNRVISLCKIIDRLHCLYERNLQLSRELVKIYTPPLLTYLFYIFALSTVQLFVFYFVACSHNAASLHASDPTWKKGKCSMPIFTTLFPVISMVADTCLLVWGTHLMEAQLAATSLILAENSIVISLARGMCSHRCWEYQLETSLDEFTLYLRMEHQQQQKDGQRYVYFMICGLFALERRLLFVLFETILNYLIILIQSDKVS